MKKDVVFRGVKGFYIPVSDCKKEAPDTEDKVVYTVYHKSDDWGQPIAMEKGVFRYNRMGFLIFDKILPKDPDYIKIWWKGTDLENLIDAIAEAESN